LPHLDFYVPSFKEASHQTGETDPERIVGAYRAVGAVGLIGVKLGTRGALLSPQVGEYLEIASIAPPGDILDTTGAGDCFFGGMLAGILRGLSIADAGTLAAACGACCVTGLGATTAIRSYKETARLAGIT
jgi:sugar/nucleoside kinase (ribokinase family)